MRALWLAVRRVVADVREANERLVLINQPWREDWLHWSPDGTLHGAALPSRARAAGVTPRGWCSALAGDAARAS